MSQKLEKNKNKSNFKLHYARSKLALAQLDKMQIIAPKKMLIKSRFKLFNTN
jgi:hypothetical protein